MADTNIGVEHLEGGIAVVTLCRPGAANALTVPMVHELRAALLALDVEGDARAVVLASEGKAFCAGLDLKEAILGRSGPSGPAECMALQEAFSGLMQDMVRLRLPVVAAVNGAAVGAGMGLALAADVRLATPSAKFMVGAIKLGLSAGECGISYHLPRLIGAGRAYEIMLTGRNVDGEEAISIGLVTSLASAETLLDQAVGVARRIAVNSPYAVKHTKQVMRANVDAPSIEAAIELENHVQVVGLLTEDFREACRAFVEKRAPKFSGR